MISAYEFILILAKLGLYKKLINASNTERDPLIASAANAILFMSNFEEINLFGAIEQKLFHRLVPDIFSQIEMTQLLDECKVSIILNQQKIKPTKTQTKKEIIQTYPK